MNIVATRTISEFNKKYNVIYTKEIKNPLGWDKTCQKIILSVFYENKKHINLYNEIYELCLSNKTDVDTLLNYFIVETK